MLPTPSSRVHDMTISMDHSLWWFMSPTALLSLVSYLAYFAYRILCLVSAQRTFQDEKPRAFDPLDPTTSDVPLALAWCFLVFECVLCVPNLIPLCVRILSFRRSRYRTSSSGPVLLEAPTVDILITCCLEAEDVILDTVRAACRLEYPIASYRVFLCDDGASTSLQSAVESLTKVYPNLHYTTRPRGAVNDYKAGNLNHGLRYSRGLSRATISSTNLMESEKSSTVVKSSIASTQSTPEIEGKALTPLANFYPARHGFLSPLYPGSSASEFVVGLDADMIPEPHMLLALMPPLLEDPRIAMVSSPQVRPSQIPPYSSWC